MPNPFYPLLPNTSLSGATVARSRIAPAHPAPDPAFPLPPHFLEPLLADNRPQTTGMLDLRGGGSDLDVDATVGKLDAKELPNLTGKKVIFVGLGQVAGPQPPLTPRLYTAVRDLWLRVCGLMNAECDPVVRPAPGGQPHATTPVPIIPVRASPTVTTWGDLDTGQTTKILLPNGVYFVKDHAEFLPGADQALSEMVHYLVPDSISVPQSATAIGHTATYGPASTAVTLSRERARRVVDAL